MTVDVPDEVADVLREEELQNIEDRRGWAIGTVVKDEQGDVTDRIEKAFIELQNGRGRAGAFGGLKFLAVNDDGEYEEAYAFATREAYGESEQHLGWYVEEFTDPEDPDYGQAAP